MSPEWVVEIVRNAMMLAVALGGPFMIVAMGLGLGISILQAATQVNEMTLAFVPKVIGAGACLWIGGGWMLERWLSFTREMITVMGPAAIGH